MTHNYQCGVTSTMNTSLKRYGKAFILFTLILVVMFTTGQQVFAAGGPGGQPGISEDDNSNDGSGNLQNELDRVNPGDPGNAPKTAPEKTKNKKGEDCPKAEPPKKSTPAPKAEKSGEEDSTEAVPWEMQQQKKNTVEGGKLPDLDGMNPAPKPVDKKPPVKVKKNEGLNRNFSLRFRDKIYQFSENPLALIKGKLYVCVSDPDFKRMFDEMGLTYSWFSYSGKLFIYMRKGSIKWNTGTTTAAVGDRAVDLPACVSKTFGDDYLPVESLAKLLNFQVIETGAVFEVKPSISVASEFSSENKTLNILVSSASQVKYDARYQANPPAIRLTLPRAGYEKELDKFFVEGVEVRVNNQVDPDNLYLTVEFPPHWKGEIIPTSYKNEVVMQMKPNLVYAYDSKDESLKSVDVQRYGDQIYALFNTSSGVQYYWSYDKDEGTLYIDLPFCKPGFATRLKNYKTEWIKSMELSTLQPDGINITRIRIDLKPGADFMIGPPEKQEGHSFALLVGPAKKIPDPSPRVGGSSIMMLAGGGGNNIIVIDPGHGGSDPGACNGAMGLREKDITLDIAKQMASILTKHGWKVYLTRYRDTDLTYPGSPDRDELQARCDVANRLNASLFISIHCNASVSRNLKGSSYHWYKKKDKSPAIYLSGSLGQNIGTQDKGIRRDQFYVLSHCKVPAVLVETAFISNAHDAQLLASDICRKKIAVLLSSAIGKYLRESNMARKERKEEDAEE